VGYPTFYHLLWQAPPLCLVQEPSIPDDCVINVSENGWTNNKLGAKWLKHFRGTTLFQSLDPCEMSRKHPPRAPCLITASHEVPYAGSFRQSYYCFFATNATDAESILCQPPSPVIGFASCKPPPINAAFAGPKTDLQPQCLRTP
jgi:hypothetical protein